MQDPTALTFDVLAADFDAVRQDLGASHVAVLGYSIMGVVALEYGRRSPETVSHVIMAGTPPTKAVFAQTPMRFFDPRADAAALFSDVRSNAGLFEHVYGPLMARWSPLEGVESLRVPVLLAHGRYDYAVPYTCGPTSSAGFPTPRCICSSAAGTNPSTRSPRSFQQPTALLGRQPVAKPDAETANALHAAASSGSGARRRLPRTRPGAQPRAGD
ncbi:MAG: alpha/beta fold hydrolase [Vicinamibacterales bacterium]